MPEIPKQAKQQISQSDIIQQYADLSGSKLVKCELLKDTGSNRFHKLWEFKGKVLSPLMTEIDGYSYLFIKKKWVMQQEYWTNERSIGGYGKMGIIIPLAVYEHIVKRKDTTTELVLCVLNNGYEAGHAFFSTTVEAINKFAKKHYTIFTSLYQDEVIGLPYSIFNRI
jgi:hypothetical protein